MKQSIVEAAYDYATEKTNFRKDVLKEVDKDSYATRHSDCMEDFQCGAWWQLDQSKWIPVKEQLPDASNFGVSDNVLLKVSIKNKKCKGIYNTYQCCIEAFYDSGIEQWCYLPPIDEKDIKITPVAWREIND